MTLEFWNGIPIFDDSTDPDLLFAPQFGRGLVERDFELDPIEMRDAPRAMELIPRSEWDARFEEQERQQSGLDHIYLRAGWPHLDQGSHGYCWSHSVTHAIMIARQRDNQPYVPLSAFAIAATIKSGRNEGGWCGLAMKFARERGIPSQSLWPQGRADFRTFDKPEVWANALLHRPDEDWFDVSAAVHGQRLSEEQMATSLFLNQPCAHDNMAWAHSVAVLRWVRVEAGSFCPLILNSWRGWGNKGLGILRGRYARIDGACGVRTVRIAA